MKYAVLLVFFILAQGIHAQPPKAKTSTTKKPVASQSKPRPKPVPSPVSPPLSEKEQFDKASAHELASARVAALEKFLTNFPESENRSAAADLLASSRGLIAEEKLLAGDPVEAVKMFRLVIADAPSPVPDELFKESIAKIPSTLFRRGQSEAAFELAGLIEAKVENSTAHLLEIANFFIGIENGGEAMRVAAKAVAKDPNSAPAYRTLALAHRINFDLEESASAYAKALEVEPGSAASIRGLAEMKRALGKSDEAASLFRELLAKNEADTAARTGLVLSLFDAGKRTDAETELAAALDKNPGNVVLLAGAAYWYASRGIGAKAVELAEKALAREPRYIWSHIALARGLMAEGKPVSAEQVLVKARAHGNFPTLEYELASARASAGFYREAVEDLSRHFNVSTGGVKTHLGGRVPREEKSLFDLVAYERKASILAPVAADTPENSEILRALLELDQKLNAATPNETEIAAAADAFVNGTDKMRVHRQLHAASLLLQKRVATAKVLELVKAATGKTDTALEVASPGSAVMASELYESRATAFRANDFLLVPDVPRPTLSAILRGRIEELAGWALYQQGNYPDSVVRLRRAITVMPDKSAWWRSSMWRLGAALAADGKDAEALNAYVESYKTDKPDFGKYAVIESLYKKVNGSTEGLEAKVGADRVAVMQTNPELMPAATPAATPTAESRNDAARPAVVTETSNAPALKPAAASSAETVTTLNAGEKVPAADKDRAVPQVTSEPVKSEPVDAKPQSETAESEKAKGTKVDAPIVEPKAGEATKETPAEPKPDEVKKDPGVDTPVNKGTTSVDAEIPLNPTTTGFQKLLDADPKKGEVRNQPTVEITDTKTADDRLEKRAERTVAEKEKPAATKPLFEPIIITIPRPKPVKPAIASPDTAGDESRKTDGEVTPAGGTKATTAVSGEARPRLVDGREVSVDGPEPCKINLSQESVSVISDGGRVGLLVHVEAPGDAKHLTAISSRPRDIEVIMEPEISGIPDRRFFVIKSVSPAIGVYQITFATPCGKKDLIVTAR